MKPADQLVPSAASEEQVPTVSHRLARIDYLGAFLLTATTVVFLYSLAGDIDWLALGLSLCLLAAFLYTEHHLAADPIIPVSVLSSRGVLLSCLAQLGLMSARWTLLYFAPVWMLAVRGFAPATSGMILVPTNLGFSVGGIVVGWLHIRRPGSFWLPCVAVFAASAVSFLVLAALSGPGASLHAFVLVVFVNGVATGAALNYTLAHLLHVCHPGTEYVASSLLATFRGFGGPFGTMIGGGIFSRGLRARLARGYLAVDGGRHLSRHHQELMSLLQNMPNLVFWGRLSREDQQVALWGYANAVGTVWQASGILMFGMMAIQAATGWTAPSSNSTEARGEPEQSPVPASDSRDSE